ncbi:hypothetical protein [Oceanicoccus sp. KOV_DT_Chl]|uniref:hypothetical protein n=1 Tax=Oceanicoccus sp. KOV_DT_Chl TaxID=1904639 RepID=UPI00190EC576|nr:hypothetical protein [Oceanicoccus sp. KOV_DT_Chl]
MSINEQALALLDLANGKRLSKARYLLAVRPLLGNSYPLVDSATMLALQPSIQNTLQHQPSMPEVCERWQQHLFRHSITTAAANTLIRELLSAIEDVNQLTTQAIVGSKTTATKDSINDYPVRRPPKEWLDTALNHQRLRPLQLRQADT